MGFRFRLVDFQNVYVYVCVCVSICRKNWLFYLLFVCLFALILLNQKPKLCSFRMNAIATAQKQSVSVNNVWYTECVMHTVYRMQYDLLSMGACMRNAFDVVAPSEQKKEFLQIWRLALAVNILIYTMKQSI